MIIYTDKMTEINKPEKLFEGTFKNETKSLYCECCAEIINTENIYIFQKSIKGGIQTIITCDKWRCFRNSQTL